MVADFFKGNIDGLVKSPSIPQSGRVRVEPFEFTSNGGGGEALPRRVKRRNATFYKVINIKSKKFVSSIEKRGNMLQP